jgi:hypothetical protein
MATEFATRVLCKHGRAKLLMGAEPDELARSSEELLDAITKGFTVDRCTVVEARKTPFGCDECKW